MSEMKHKIGDIVRIRCDLKLNGSYQGVLMLPEKMRFCGLEATITGFNNFDQRFYKISLDGGEFNWTDETFDDTYEEQQFCVDTTDIENLFYE